MELYTWDWLESRGVIPVNKEVKRASAFLVFPEEDAQKAAMVLGNHIIEESINIDVGIWRDENIFVFFVSNKEEARKLFSTNIIKDHPKVLAIRTVSSRMCAVYTRSTREGEVTETLWNVNKPMGPLTKIITMSENTLSGLLVRTSYLPWPPSVFEKMENDEIQSLWGYEISIFEAIASKRGWKLNITSLKIMSGVTLNRAEMKVPGQD